MSETIRLKRVYDPPEPGDGKRFLADRIWPRGIKKESLQLDGWLIKSENFQALNTILKKFKERVQTIFIDPPFNKEQDADYFYSVVKMPSG